MRHRRFHPGDPVVYHKAKVGPHPTLRAHHVHPSPCGDDYCYVVDKYWRVLDQLNNGRVVVLTRRGKQHTLDDTDPCLRRARWYERWFLRERFPDAAPSNDVASHSAG